MGLINIKQLSRCQTLETGSLLVYIIIIGTIAVGVVTYYVMKQDKLRV